MNVTLDGFMAGTNCELDWHFSYWDDEMAQHASERLSMIDTILLGRITYQAMARYWPAQTMNSYFPRESIAFAEMMNNYRKVVFSKTLKAPVWNNSRIARYSLDKEIQSLKLQGGKDMIVYGSGSVVSGLIQLGLVDEYELWVHPVLIGKGKPFFRELHAGRTLVLSGTRVFGSGVVILDYRTLS